MLLKKTYWISLITSLLIINNIACSEKSKVTCSYGNLFKINFDYISIKDAENETRKVIKELNLPEERLECLKELF